VCYLAGPWIAARGQRLCGVQLALGFRDIFDQALRPDVLSSRGAIDLPSAPSISRSVNHTALHGIEGDEIVQGLLDMMYAKGPYT
jgi:hypothetical protein